MLHHSPFLFPLFLGGKRKGEWSSKSRDQKSYLPVSSNKYDQLLSFFPVIIAIWDWIVQYFSSYLHDKYCIFASILLITNKRILYLNKLTWKYNVFMSMTWKLFFFKYECILCYKRCIEYKLANVSLMCGVVCTTDCYSAVLNTYYSFHRSNQHLLLIF